MWSCPALRAASIRAPTRRRLETGTVAVLAGGHDRIYPPRERAAAARHPGAGRGGDLRNAHGLGAARTRFSAPQPDRLRPVLRGGGGRGGAALRLAHHRAVRPGTGPGGLCRAGFAPRSARRGHQRSHPRRRDPLRRRRACDERARAPDRRRPASRHGYERAAASASERRNSGTSSTSPTSAAPPVRHRAAGCGIGDEPARRTIEVDLVALPRTLAGRRRRSRAAIGASIRQVQMALLELEIAGRLERHGGNAVSLIAARLSGLRRLSCSAARPGSPPAAPCRADRPADRARLPGEGGRARR